MRVHVFLLILASAVVVLIGQVHRELLPPDDLREVEIAREMYVSGDYVVPYLAGLPFVEKPSGFPAVVATAFRLAGGPSAAAARCIAAIFALASLLAVFLLGRRIMGVQCGAYAAAFLAISQRFCRTAHEVLLDNALTAALAFAVLFTWIALDSDSANKKRIAYAAACLSLGISFLFKGFVGIALFGSGFLLYLVMSRRTGELRHILRPLPVTAFLIPFLAWTVPFILNATPDLIWEFFITNHLSRFLSGYMSHHRPVYFYLLDIWTEFAPGSILLPPAVWWAWKSKREHENQAGIFLLSMVIGPLLFLSASTAKDSVYLLPAYPALATLVAWCAVKSWSLPHNSVNVFSMASAGIAILAAGIAMGIDSRINDSAIPVSLAFMVFAPAAAACLVFVRKHDFSSAGVCMVILFALAWGLWFSRPMSLMETEGKSIRHPIDKALGLAGNRDIVLYLADDGIRGATGFYRNRTAQEIRSPEELVARLGEDPERYVVLTSRHGRERESLPPELLMAGIDAGVDLRISAHIDYGSKHLLLIEAIPEGIGEKVVYRQKSL